MKITSKQFFQIIIKFNFYSNKILDDKDEP